MKKTFLSLGILTTLALSANAQDVATGSEFKPTAGNITVELNALSPFAGQNNGAPFGLGSTAFGTSPALRFRYFLSDGLAFRVQFSIDAHRQKQDYGSVADLTGSTSGNPSGTATLSNTPIAYKVTSSSTLVSIAPGLEIHKDISERLSVYYGGYIDFAIQSAKGKITGTPGSSNSATTTVNNGTINSAASAVTSTGSYTYEVKGENFTDLNGYTGPTGAWGVTSSQNLNSPGNLGTIANGNTRGFTRIGLVGVIGADYYITKALYLGVETGWGFATTSYKKITSTEAASTIVDTATGGGPSDDTPSTVTIKTVENKDSQLDFNPFVNAAFRLGFWF